MLTLCILGFLYEHPLHAYDLRQRLSGLSGHIRPVSDGALYPALNRLQAAGHLTKHTEPGAGATPRNVLTLTDSGRAELLRRLRDPAPVEITDRNSFLTLLAFLGHLPDPADQIRVLRRRLEFMDQPASYFYEQGRPLRARDMTDRFRRGMLTLAGATSRADRAWLVRTIAELEAELAATPDPPTR
ncbi:PadR family transcriptional regulator [Goodfellowiella coeruleoviolacea]|uniref:DNA-binding transcriptional regulator, PadR family n=1 Tax=Goodfellowiella coeruleoviolacea TaxID=334858 RepID=A0AAE3GKA6_9PSEU|nr:PadR family transcriptional regulator [Goodfellowiella coeruleoviolacea]MCP2168774.1 DNA-binding transcriptional regulator, PadR family [Goodfellowiella coeruleoviolacea]